MKKWRQSTPAQFCADLSHISVGLLPVLLCRWPCPPHRGSRRRCKLITPMCPPRSTALSRTAASIAVNLLARLSQLAKRGGETCESSPDPSVFIRHPMLPSHVFFNPFVNSGLEDNLKSILANSWPWEFSAIVTVVYVTLQSVPAQNGEQLWN